MSADTFFYAGLAGARQNTIDDLDDTIDQWRAYCDQLKAQNQQLMQELAKANYIAEDWMDAAVTQGAQKVVVSNLLKKRTGQGAFDYYGEAEFDRLTREQIPASRKAFGLKD